MREHIPSYQLHMGQRVYVVPRDDSTPRGPKLNPIPLQGMEVRVDDYLYGCIQRGALLAYSLKVLECQAAPQSPAPAAEPLVPVPGGPEAVPAAAPMPQENA